MLRQLLVFWLLTLSLFADHVLWYGNYDKALQLAHKEYKPLLVLVVKSNSQLCSSIIKNQFMNQSYIKKMNTKTIPVIVTYEGGENYPIEMYYTTTFPTLFFVDSQKELFLREPLYGEAIHEKVLHEIMNHF